MADPISQTTVIRDRIHTREAECKLIEIAQRLYASRSERAAMRGALMDAAALLDALAIDISDEHTIRGRITNQGVAMAALVTDCANAVFAMREKIEVPSV